MEPPSVSLPISPGVCPAIASWLLSGVGSVGLRFLRVLEFEVQQDFSHPYPYVKNPETIMVLTSTKSP